MYLGHVKHSNSNMFKIQIFKYLNIQQWACPVCNIEMEGWQPGRATENRMPRAEDGVLRMPHYEVESQGWVQGKQPTKHLS